jgi:hypothetical protein
VVVVSAYNIFISYAVVVATTIILYHPHAVRTRSLLRRLGVLATIMFYSHTSTSTPSTTTSMHYAC